MVTATKKAAPKGLSAILSDNAPMVEQIKMSQIHQSDTNPRKTFDNSTIEDLAESMKTVGLLQPITLRPQGKNYEIVAGERRFRAARELKWTTIPAMVREVSDDEMLEIQIIENLQREEVSPIDEAHAFQTLLKKESVEWLASKVHKPKKYILDRLKLTELIEEAQQLVEENVLPLGHAIMISKLSFADQKAALQFCMRRTWRGDDELKVCSQTSDELRQHINNNILLEFDRVSFPLDDAELYPAAGPCTTCPKRTCNANLLFQEITEDDMCTDPSCFHEKIKLHVDREKARAKEAHGQVIAGEKTLYGSNNEVKVQGVVMKVHDMPTKNSIPVVITKAGKYGHDQKHLGRTVYVDKKKLEAAKLEQEEGKKASAKGSSESYQDTQKRMFIEETWPRLQKIAGLRESNATITREFFREQMGTYSIKKKFMALAGVLGLNGFAKDAAMAWETGRDYDHGFFKLMFDGVIDHFGLEMMPMVIALVGQVDEDEDVEIDHEEEFGYTWNEMIHLLGL